MLNDGKGIKMGKGTGQHGWTDRAHESPDPCQQFFLILLCTAITELLADCSECIDSR